MSCVPQPIRDRAVLLSEGLFAWVVAANLETRTSISIDPETGAAEEGALFTFEAVPRATVFRFEAVFQDGRTFRIGNESLRKEKGGDSVDAPWVRDNVEKGLGLLESLGVGGMTTRGMGRLRVLNLGGSA
jgi:CRISPR-associated protein Cmr4